MKKIKFSYMSVLIFTLSLLLITLLNFVDLFKTNFANILIYIVFFILLSLNSFKIALKSKDRGIITGIKLGSFISLIVVILKFIFKVKFNLFSFIYILLMFLFSVIPSIYASNKKSSNS